MTWRVVATSVIGTSHMATGAKCEDSCIALIETASNKPPLLTVFVADGAGSASHGGKGADLAVEAATEFVGKQYLKDLEFALNENWAVECIQAVRARVYESACLNGVNARNYACTFLGVVASPFATLLMQIGDGGILVDVGNGLEVPIAPMAGEYANMTNFVTDEDAIDVLEVAAFSTRADKVAVFSDGVQRLALNMATNTPHLPFFNPFFEALARATAQQEIHFESELAQFLQCPAVNERTDDDKTLVLAHWID